MRLLFISIQFSIIMRALLLTVLLWISIMASAEKHLTFLGMPINGQVWDFESQLEMRGFVPSGASLHLNKYLGGDCYRGVIDGHKVVVIVIYTKDINNVYEINVCYPFLTRSEASSFYDSMTKTFSHDYEFVEDVEITLEGEIRCERYVAKDNGQPIGHIHITDSSDTYGLGDGVIVQYIDHSNLVKKLKLVDGVDISVYD